MLDSLELGRVDALLGAPLVERRHPRRRPRRAGVRRPRRHGDRPLRRLQVRRRVDAVAGQVLAQQRRRHGRARRGGDARRRARHRVLVVVLGVRHAGRGAGRRVGADRPGERVRRAARRWSSGSSTGTASPRACARSSLRYFNAAGASHDAAIGEDWTFSINLIPLVMKAVLGAGPPVKVFGNDYPTPDGTCIRDYIHVEDLADAHIRALDRLSAGLPDGAYSLAVNLGTGVGSSVLDVIKATEAVAGRAGAARDRRPARRRPGRHLRRPDRRRVGARLAGAAGPRRDRRDPRTAGTRRPEPPASMQACLHRSRCVPIQPSSNAYVRPLDVPTDR